MRINKKYRALWVGKYRYAIISGGRGSGKSYAVQTFLRDLSYQAGHKIASTRYTLVSAEKSVIPEFVGKLELDKSPYGGGAMVKDFEIIGKNIKNLKSESEVFFMGLKTSSGIQTASLKSIEGLTTFHMEEAEELIDDGTETEACTLDKIDDSVRKKGIDLRTILVWNPSNEDSLIYKRFFKDLNIEITFNGIVDNVLYIHTTYEDNLENLHPSFIAKAEKTKFANRPRYDHIYGGIPIKENAFALWKKTTMIAPYRVGDAPPELKRIVVGVDPSATSTGHQDECGILIGGEDHNGHYYILRDDSGQMDPISWARTAVGAFHDFNADKIVAEANQGYEMVKITIDSIEKNLPIELVVATRGKIVRAEPVSALYQEGKVHHVGHFPELELEMTSYTGAKSEKSPNRLDALVWLLTDLANLKVKQDASLFIGGV